MIFPTSYPLFPSHSLSALSYGYPMVFCNSSIFLSHICSNDYFNLHSSFFHYFNPHSSIFNFHSYRLPSTFQLSIIGDL